MNFAHYSNDWGSRVIVQSRQLYDRFSGNEVKKMTMDEASLEGKVNDLVKEFGGINNPQCRKLAMLAQKAHTNHEKLKKSVNSLQESLDYLRICIKYQLFDLEATRRENEYLKEMLDEKNK